MKKDYRGMGESPMCQASCLPLLTLHIPECSWVGSPSTVPLRNGEQIWGARGKSVFHVKLPSMKPQEMVILPP